MELKIKERIDSYMRVLSIAKKPTFDDFVHSAAVTALGLGLLGAVGFALYIVSIMFLG